MGTNNDFDTKIKVEKFAEQLDIELEEVERFVSFLNGEDKYMESLHKSVKILKKKLKKIKSSKNLDEVSKIIKLNKLKKKFGDE